MNVVFGGGGFDLVGSPGSVMMRVQGTAGEELTDGQGREIGPTTYEGALLGTGSLADPI